MKSRKLITLLHQYYKELRRAHSKGYSILPLIKYIFIYINQNRVKRDRLELGVPWLVQDVVDFLEDNILEGQKVFEFGSGASSHFFLRKGLYLISVEHDKDWFFRVNKFLRNKGYNDFSLNLIEPELNHSNIARITSLRDKRFLNHDFYKYSTFILKFPDNYFDVILIDGRARVECLRNSLNKVKKEGFVILDNSERPDYLEKIENFNLKLVYKSFGFVQYDLGFTETSVFKVI